MGTTWNPDDKHANIALSNGNLTATATSTAHKMARATKALSSGKKYFEIHITVRPDQYQYHGIATAGHTLAAYLGAVSTGWSYDSGGYKRTNAVATLVGTTLAVDDILGVAVDLDSGKIWWSKNNTWIQGSPAAGTGESYQSNTIRDNPIFPATSLYSNTASSTLRTGAGDCSYDPPSGFSFWDAEAEQLLEDLSLDLSAYRCHHEDFASFLRTHDGIEYRDLQAALTAAGWEMEDLASFFSACLQELGDTRTDLSARGTRYDDLQTFFAAHFLATGQDMQAFLETWATGYDEFAARLEAALTVYKNLKVCLTAYGQETASISALLQAARARLPNFKAFLYVTDGLIFGDVGCLFTATDGVVRTDVTLGLRAVAGIPVFRSITAQKVSSVVHEV